MPGAGRSARSARTAARHGGSWCVGSVVGSACQVLFWAYACSSWAGHHVLGARVNQNPELRWYIGTKAMYLPVSMTTVGAMTFHWPERSYDIMCGNYLAHRIRLIAI